MRPHSPIRTHSPIKRPRITFNYPLSPLKQQQSNTKILSPHSNNNEHHASNMVCESKVEKYVLDKQENSHVYKLEDKTVNKRQKIQSTLKQNDRQISKGNEKNNSQTVSRGSQMPHIQLERLLKESKQMKGQMQNLLQKLSNETSAEQGIKKIYRDKKLSLKKHYELIKTTIKLSIQKDLQELELREKKSMKCLQQVKTQLTAEILSMSSLKHRIQNIFNEVSYSSDISQLYSILNQAKQSVTSATQQKAKASEIANQLACKQGSQPQGDSLSVKLTNQQLQETRRELYDSSTYTLLLGDKAKGDTLFSFQHKK